MTSERLPDPAGFGVMLPSFDQFATGSPPVAEAAARAEELGFAIMLHAVTRAAGLGDAWHPVWLGPKQLAARVAQLDELTEQLGRPRLAVPLMAVCCVTDDVAAARRTADVYLQGQYRLGLERAERWCAIGDAEEVAGGIRESLDAGATGLILVPLSDDPLGQMESLAALRERLPALGDRHRAVAAIPTPPASASAPSSPSRG